MDPVFTLSWPEFYLAERLQTTFPKSDGYSILIPASRQEKGIDLAILKCSASQNRVVTLQVKASRTWVGEPRTETNRRWFRYTANFKRFELPKNADFFLLAAFFPPDPHRTKRINARWYRDCTLLLTNSEMRNLLENCLTRRGTSDCMFYIAFDGPTEAFQTRGIQDGSQKDYSEFLLDRRLHLIESALV